VDEHGDRIVSATTLTFIVAGKPQGKQRARRGKGGTWYTPGETVAFETQVRNAAFIAVATKGIGKGWTGPVTLTVSCYFPDARRRDGDNVLKAVADSLNGFVYVDDSQVQTATVHKAVDREHPRTEVVVGYLEDV
jgi:Holliday junction resolvase RusA-like endonuclease